MRSRTATPQPLREAAPADISRLLRLEDEGERTLALSRRRLSIIGVCFAAGFALIGFRAVVLAASHDPDQVFIAAAAAPDAPNRGDILDRDGEILAATLDFHSVYADPKYVWDAEIAAARLTTVLPQLDAETLRRDLDSNRRFVWVARGLTPRQRQAIHLLGLPGIGFVEEPGRIYPKRRAAAHLVGYADRDLHGLSGAELAFDAALSAGDGRPVSLSIDLTAQHAVESVLRARMAHFRAEGASAVLMRVGTGEILALASLPDFDPNRPNDAPNSARFNRASEGVYELGSVFKPLTLAAALESGAVALDDVFDATDPISIGGFRIRDFHPERRPMTAREAVIHSSNIATARMAETLDGVRLRQFFQDLRLLERAPVELAESGRPLTPAAPWSTIETMTISYGHGMAISPLALTAAYAALANGGVYTPPTLRPVAPGEIIVGEPVMSAETSAAVLAVMRQVVTQGSGRRADVDGLAVAGKTGTAERVVGGRYDTDSLFTSFVSIFPFDDPEYVLLVSFDRPKAAPETHGFATAGWNAAPTSGEMIMRLSSILGVELRETDPQARASAVAMMFAPRARTRARPEEPLLLNPLAPEDVSGE
ncbi:MAG: penicillin-binding protein 2 [Pseudomonadota bacterium]